MRTFATCCPGVSDIFPIQRDYAPDRLVFFAGGLHEVLRCFCRIIIAPQPRGRRRQFRGALPVVVFVDTEGEVMVIAFEPQRVRHSDVGHRPATSGVVEIFGAILKPYANIALRFAAHHGGIFTPSFGVLGCSAQGRVAADLAQHA